MQYISVQYTAYHHILSVVSTRYYFYPLFICWYQKLFLLVRILAKIFECIPHLFLAKYMSRHPSLYFPLIFRERNSNCKACVIFYSILLLHFLSALILFIIIWIISSALVTTSSVETVYDVYIVWQTVSLIFKIKCHFFLDEFVVGHSE